MEERQRNRYEKEHHENSLSSYQALCEVLKRRKFEKSSFCCFMSSSRRSRSSCQTATEVNFRLQSWITKLLFSLLLFRPCVIAQQQKRRRQQEQQPTAFPTLSQIISTDVPSTISPSFSPKPSLVQTPTVLLPTLLPYPTPLEFYSLSDFQQIFVIKSPDVAFEFNSRNETILGVAYSELTEQFAPFDYLAVDSLCVIASQSILTDPALNGTGQGRNQVNFNCSYTSSTVNTTDFPNLFEQYLSNSTNLGNFQDNLIAQGLQFVSLQAPTIVLVISAVNDEVQTTIPTASPTLTASPVTAVVTGYPTPLETVPIVEDPTASPSNGTPPALDNSRTAIISSVTVLVGFVTLFVLVYYYQRKKKQSEPERFGARAGRDDGNDMMSITGMDVVVGADGDQSEAEEEYIPEAESNLTTSFQQQNEPEDKSTDATKSHQPTITKSDAVTTGPNKREEKESTNFSDEFDHYKDRKLEQFRIGVENCLKGFEGVLSAAVTNALMGSSSCISLNKNDYMWGCEGKAAPEIVEASVLCHVNDWIKRNGSSSQERKKTFMQDILSKMVSTVRHGIVTADHGANIIHESAVLLGLPISDNLHNVTILVTGMQKAVAATEFRKAFRAFGEIDVAAVASGGKGFGIIRYKRSKGLDRALRQYRTSEIVVQDVGVQIKVIGEVEGQS